MFGESGRTSSVRKTRVRSSFQSRLRATIVRPASSATITAEAPKAQRSWRIHAEGLRQHHQMAPATSQEKPTEGASKAERRPRPPQATPQFQTKRDGPRMTGSFEMVGKPLAGKARGVFLHTVPSGRGQ